MKNEGSYEVRLYNLAGVLQKTVSFTSDSAITFTDFNGDYTLLEDFPGVVKNMALFTKSNERILQDNYDEFY